ncbi:MAG: hypothetical protein R3350_08105 [Saprospiraceae bacterium]|nr:hypothetical protein [Saprospiraceae bacterium]
MYTRVIIPTLLLVVCALTSNAQAPVVAAVHSSQIMAEKAAEQVLWKLYVDEENEFYYVDFQDFTFNINEIKLKGSEGQVLKEENVFDMPVDAIYELDMSQYAPGTYTLELKSFTRTYRKKIRLE